MVVTEGHSGYSRRSPARHDTRLTTLHLIRHGQASAGTDDYDRLSDTGRAQARTLGAWWKSHGTSLDAAWSGTLLRQRDTARLALDAAGLAGTRSELAALNEYDDDSVGDVFGDGVRDPAEWQSFTFVDYVRVMERWRDADDAAVAAGRERPGRQGLERWTDFAARGWAAVRATHADHAGAERLAFFTSGGVISTMVSTVLGLDFEHTIDAIWRIRNASITTLHFDGEHARLVEFNTVPHLLEQRDPALVTLI